MVLRKYAPWEIEHLHVDLIQPEHLEALPDGTQLFCLDGSTVIKGKDVIDPDTRYGFLAYGFLCTTKHPGESGLGVYEKEDTNG